MKSLYTGSSLTQSLYLTTLPYIGSKDLQEKTQRSPEHFWGKGAQFHNFYYNCIKTGSGKS